MINPATGLLASIAGSPIRPHLPPSPSQPLVTSISPTEPPEPLHSVYGRITGHQVVLRGFHLCADKTAYQKPKRAEGICPLRVPCSFLSPT
jgi:hypothetical protein